MRACARKRVAAVPISVSLALGLQEVGKHVYARAPVWYRLTGMIFKCRECSHVQHSYSYYCHGSGAACWACDSCRKNLDAYLTRVWLGIEPGSVGVVAVHTTTRPCLRIIWSSTGWINNLSSHALMLPSKLYLFLISLALLWLVCLNTKWCSGHLDRHATHFFRFSGFNFRNSLKNYHSNIVNNLE